MDPVDNNNVIYLHSCHVRILSDSFLDAVYDFFDAICHSIAMLGLSSFQVVAIQFGIDQLQRASSQILSAFIFWYFMTEILLGMMIGWSFYLSSFSENDSKSSSCLESTQCNFGFYCSLH